MARSPNKITRPNIRETTSRYLQRRLINIRLANNYETDINQQWCKPFKDLSSNLGRKKRGREVYRNDPMICLLQWKLKRYSEIISLRSVNVISHTNFSDIAEIKSKIFWSSSFNIDFQHNKKAAIQYNINMVIHF